MRGLAILAILLTAWGCGRGDALDDVLLKLKDPRDPVRADAVWELGKLKDPRARGALLAALADRSADVRLGAAMVLRNSSWEGPEVVAALSRATRDPHAQVREWAILGLAQIADPTAFEALHAAKLDIEPDVRRAAVDAIRLLEAAQKARLVRYHPPASVPPGLSPAESMSYLRAHEEEWAFTVLQISEAQLSGPSLSLAVGSICERPELETKAAYLGRDEAQDFLMALHRRVGREPGALVEFRRLRSELLLKFPPPRQEEAEK